MTPDSWERRNIGYSPGYNNAPADSSSALYDCATDVLTITFPDDVSADDGIVFHGPGSVAPPVSIEGAGITFTDPGVSVAGNVVTIIDFFATFIGVPGAVVGVTSIDAVDPVPNVTSTWTGALTIEEC